MQIQRNQDRIIVSADNLDGHQEISLLVEEVGRVVAGESFLRSGMIIRRWGDTVELRTARPGVERDRRVLGTIPVDQFMVS